MKFKPLSKILAITSLGVMSAAFLVAAPTPMPTSASATTLTGQLGTDLDGDAADDYFGGSVSVSDDGTRVAIGAVRGNNSDGSNSGHARVYQWNAGTLIWDQLGTAIGGEAELDAYGGSVSISGDGERVAIGGTGNDGNGSNSGHVRVYQWNAGTSSWGKLGDDIDGEAANDRSGYSVSLSDDGTRVAIGAIANGGNGSNSGHVRVYQWNAGTSSWDKLGGDIDGEAASDFSGYSVSLSDDGTRVAIGAVYNNGNGSSSGHVRVYQWNAGTPSWDQLGSDIDGEAASDYSGTSVSLSGDGTRVAIGATHNFNNGNYGAGHVRVYQWNAGTLSWVQLGQDIDGEAQDDYSSYSVSLSGDGTRVAIGAPQNDGNGSNSGHVRVYQWNAGTSSWDQLGTDIGGEAVNDYFGGSVSLSGDGTRVAIGGPRNDGNGSNSGHVRVYSTALQAQSNPSVEAPAQYSGPVLSSFSSRTLDPCTSMTITITGSRLAGISTASVQGKSATVLSNTDTNLVLEMPKNLTPGKGVDLVINSSAGSLTHQDAFDVPEGACATALPKSRWTQLQSDGKKVKMYAKDPVADGKIQFFVDGQEIAWVNASDESDLKLSFASGNPYLVRSVTLHEGKNRLEIKVDGVRVWRATYVPKG